MRTRHQPPIAIAALALTALLVGPLVTSGSARAEDAEEQESSTVTLSGTLFTDANGNGVQDAGEEGIPSITVGAGADDWGALNEPTADPDVYSPAQDVTDADGHYSIEVSTTVDFLAESGLDGDPATVHYFVNPSYDDPYEWEAPSLTRDSQGWYVIYTTTDLSRPGASEGDLNFGLRRPETDQHPDNDNVEYGQPGKWLVAPYGHGDVIYPEIDTSEDGTQSLALRSHFDGYDPLDLNNLVIYHNDNAKETLPETYTPDADYSFIAPEGSTVYRSREAGSIDGSPWIGFSTQSPTLRDLDFNHPFSFRLDAVTGYDGGAAPGDVVLWQDGGLASAKTEFSTKKAQPSVWSFANQRHTHENWSFTSSGIYCMAFSVQTEMPDGTRAETHGILTQIVSSQYDPSTIEPCGRHLDYPGVVKEPITNVDDTSPYVSNGGTAAFTARLDDSDDLQVTYNQERDYGDGPNIAHNVDDVILYGQAGINYPYRFQLGTRAGKAIGRSITWDTSQIESSDLDGDLTWTFDSVQGPGDLYVGQGSAGQAGSIGEWAADQRWDTATGQLSQQIWTGSRREDLNWSVTRPGVYCVAMTWSGTTAGGQAVSDHHTFTLVADGPLDPDDYERYANDHEGDTHSTGPMWLASEHNALDRTCADGAEPTKAEDVPVPDNGGDTPAAKPWDVANWSKTDSGATILNDGHIDIASTLEDGVFATQVKDTTAEGFQNATHDGASWHDPEDVVLQLLPGSETSVPDDPRFAFLGDPHTPLWQVTESQQEGLLWPGWSTETIPEDATQTGVQWALDRMSAPKNGQFALYHSGTQLGSVEELFNTRDGITEADSFEIAKHAHVHASWAFSAEGTYCLAFTRSTTLADGTPASDDFTLAFSVGQNDVTKVNPADCFTDRDPNAAPVPDPGDHNQSGDHNQPGDQNPSGGQPQSDQQHPDGDLAHTGLSDALFTLIGVFAGVGLLILAARGRSGRTRQ